MSPEYDQKLLSVLLANDSHANDFHSSHSQFMHAWRSLEGPRWSANGFLPTTLSAEAARVSRDELKAIPEYFYSKTGLPAITPAIVTQLIKTGIQEVQVIILLRISKHLRYQ